MPGCVSIVRLRRIRTSTATKDSAALADACPGSDLTRAATSRRHESGSAGAKLASTSSRPFSRGLSSPGFDSPSVRRTLHRPPASARGPVRHLPAQIAPRFTGFSSRLAANCCSLTSNASGSISVGVAGARSPHRIGTEISWQERNQQYPGRSPARLRGWDCLPTLPVRPSAVLTSPYPRVELALGKFVRFR